MKVAGFGYRHEAPLSSLAELLDRASKRFGAIDALAAISSKSELVTLLGNQRKLPVLLLDNDTITNVETITQSAYSQNAKGTGSVAEAVALLGAFEAEKTEGTRQGARLLSERDFSTDRMATCAVASGANE